MPYFISLLISPSHFKMLTRSQTAAKTQTKTVAKTVAKTAAKTDTINETKTPSMFDNGKPIVYLELVREYSGQTITLRSGRIIKYCKTYVRPMQLTNHDTPIQQPNTAQNTPYIFQFIKNYLDIFEDVKIKYKPNDITNHKQYKKYYIEMMRVILELFTNINQHFDTIRTRSSSLNRVIINKARDLLYDIADIENKYSLTGHHAALARNTIHELKRTIFLAN